MTTETRFAWAATAAHAWILAGLFVDGWFHIHSPGIETFFTPWHGILYSGVALAVAVIGEQIRRGRRRGVSLRAAVPEGYGLSVIGGAIFVAGAVADMAWHELLGVEVGVEALLSPTHLSLAVAGFLVVSGPLRVAWRRPGLSGTALWPAVIAAAFVVTLVAFFTQYVNPVTHLYPTLGAADDLLAAAGIAGTILYAALIAGALVVLTGRRRLPPGAVIAVVAIPPVAMTTLRATFFLLPAIVTAGIAGEALVAVLRPRVQPATLVRVTAGVVPAVFTALCMASLPYAADLTWSSHLVGGAIVLSGLTGAVVGIVATLPAPQVDDAVGPAPARRELVGS